MATDDGSNTTTTSTFTGNEDSARKDAYMRQRPCDPDPAAGQRRPRTVRPSWIDRLPMIAYSSAATIFVITASATTRQH